VAPPLFPKIGNSRGNFSKAWKIPSRFFQALETRRRRPVALHPQWRAVGRDRRALMDFMDVMNSMDVHPVHGVHVGSLDWPRSEFIFQASWASNADRRKSQNHANKIMTQEAGNIRVDDFVTMILSKSSSRPRAFPVGFPRLGKIRAEFSKARNNGWRGTADFVSFVACCAMPFLLSSFTLWKSVQSRNLWMTVRRPRNP